MVPLATNDSNDSDIDEFGDEFGDEDDDEAVDNNNRSMSLLDISETSGGSGSYGMSMAGGMEMSHHMNASSIHSNRTGTTGGEGDGMLQNAERGDKIISASRCIFFSVLFMAAAVLATVAYVLYQKEETQNFERSFMNKAEEIILSTNHNVDSAFATLRGLSTSTTSVVKRTSAVTGLPPGFIQLPDIQFHLGLARNTTDALVIAYMPKVLNADYDTWMEYAEEHKGWVSDEQPDGPVDFLPEISPYIWEYTDESNFTTADAAVLINEVVEEYDAQVVMATTDTTNADTTNAAATTTAANTTTTTTTTTRATITRDKETRRSTAATTTN
mmetsp:Transcript_38627/g.43110  ORF Transcript_38627/g.43110 Transcript_38627/m.43110 type:complete len:329 (+) Transcript_38627:287-1273(+)